MLTGWRPCHRYRRLGNWFGFSSPYGAFWRRHLATYDAMKSAKISSQVGG